MKRKFFIFFLLITLLFSSFPVNGVSATPLTDETPPPQWTSLHSEMILGTEVVISPTTTHYIYTYNIATNEIEMFAGEKWQSIGHLTIAEERILTAKLAITADGSLYVAGSFDQVNGIAAQNIAKWDGYNWTPLVTSIDGTIGDIIAVDNAVYIGGLFTQINGSDSYRLAKLENGSWSQVGPGYKEIFTEDEPYDIKPIEHLAMGNNGHLFAVSYNWSYNNGDFITCTPHYSGGVGESCIEFAVTTLYEFSANEIYSINTLSSPVTVEDIAVNAGNVYIGTQYGIYRTDLTVERGMFEVIKETPFSFFPHPCNCSMGYREYDITTMVTNKQVYGMGIAPNGDLYVSLFQDGIWKAVGTTWFPITPNIISGYAYSFAFADDRVLAAGRIQLTNKQRPISIIEWNGAGWATGWKALGAGINDTYLNKIMVDPRNNDIYTASLNKIYRWNGVVWNEFANITDGYVSDMVMNGDGQIYVGGGFTAINGVTAKNVAFWSGTEWRPLNTGLSSHVRSVTLDKYGVLYAGGDFSLSGAGEVGLNNIASWNGSEWQPVGVGFNNSVYDVAFDNNNNLYASGLFSNLLDGTPVRGIARWDGTDWLSLGLGTATNEPLVYAMAVMANGTIYAGGKFSPDSGQTWSKGVYKWNGLSWQKLGNIYNAYNYYMGDQETLPTQIVAGKDGVIYATGMRRADDLLVNGIAAWKDNQWQQVENSQGLWGGNIIDTYADPTSSYASILINSLNTAYVKSAAVSPLTGDLYLAGDFDTAGETPALNIVRYDTSGTFSLQPYPQDTILDFLPKRRVYDNEKNYIERKGSAVTSWVLHQDDLADDTPEFTTENATPLDPPQVTMPLVGSYAAAGKSCYDAGSCRENVTVLPPGSYLRALLKEGTYLRVQVMTGADSYPQTMSGNLYIDDVWAARFEINPSSNAVANFSDQMLVNIPEFEQTHGMTVGGEHEIQVRADMGNPLVVRSIDQPPMEPAPLPESPIPLDPNYDITPPVLTANLIPDGWTNGNVLATATATDAGVGVDHVYCKANLTDSYTDGGAATCSLDYAENGVFYYYAVDKNNNTTGTAEAPLSLLVNNIDKIAPQINASVTQAGSSLVWQPLGDGVDSTVFATAISNDKQTVYAGGTFSTAGSTAVEFLAKWDAATSSWSSVGAPFENYVEAIILSPDQNTLYVAGDFTGGVAKMNTADQTWTMLDIPGSYVKSLALANDGTLYAASNDEEGLATLYSLPAAASNWIALGNFGYDYVSDLILAPDQTTLYVAGYFSEVNGLPANNLAVLDITTQTWSSLGGTDDWVQTLALSPDGQTLFMGGDFTEAGGVAVNKLAKLDLINNNWSALGDGVSQINPADYSQVSDLALNADGSILYVAGEFTIAGGNSANNLALYRTTLNHWEAIGNGVTSTNGYAVLNDIALSSDGQLLALGGNFDTAAQNNTNNIVLLEKNDDVVIDLAGVNNTVYASAISPIDGKLYLGGAFTQVGGTTANYVASWDQSNQSWSNLGGGIEDPAHGDFWKVYSLAFTPNGDLYAAGYFGVGSDLFIAKWNGTTWVGLPGGLDYESRSLAVSADGQSVYVGGGFNTAGGQEMIDDGIARFDTTTQTWHSVGDGTKLWSLNSIAVNPVDGKLYVAGYSYTNNEYLLARLEADQTWTTLASGVDIYALAFDATGNLYVGGLFSNFNSVADTNSIVRWDGTNWTPLATGLNYTVNEITVANNLVYVGGSFDQADGITANRVAVWDGSSWSSLGNGVSDTVYALSVDANQVYVGGNFAQAESTTANYIARYANNAWSTLSAVTPMTSGTVLVTVNAVDFGGSGLEHVYCKSNTDPDYVVEGVSSCTRTFAANDSLAYYALDNAGNMSEVGVLDIETLSPPSLTTTVTPSTWTRETVTATVEAVSTSGATAITTYCKANLEDAYTVGSNNCSLNYATNGLFYYYAEDSLGNRLGSASNPLSLAITNIDLEAPLASANFTPTTWTQNVLTTVTASDEASGVAHIYCKTDLDADYTDSGTAPCQNTFTANGILSYYVVDQVGNSFGTALEPKTLAITNIDMTPPTASAALEPTTTTTGNVLATATAIDNLGGSGIAHIYCRMNSESTYLDGGTTGCSRNFVSNGVFYYYAVDVAGNYDGSAINPYSIEINNIDKIPPYTNVVLAPSTWTNGNVTATVTAFDPSSPVAHVYCKTDLEADFTDGGSNNCAKTFTENGVFSYYAVDATGNSTGSAAEPLTMAVTNIERVAPVATVTLSPATLTNGDVIATVNASDLTSGVAHVYCKTNLESAFTDGGLVTCAKNFLVNGSLAYYVVDQAGNTLGTEAEPIVVNINNIDKDLPEITTAINPTGWTNSNVIATATALDAGGNGIAHVYCKTDQDVDFTDGGEGVTTCSREFLTNGIFSYYAIDQAGNSRGSAVAPLTLNISNIDKIAPTAEVTLTPATLTNGTVVASILATDAASGLANLYCKTNLDPDYILGVGGVCERVFNDNGVLSYYAVDQAGNSLGSSLEPLTVAITNISHEAPSATITQIPTGWTNTDVVVTLSGTGTNLPLQARYNINGGAWSEFAAVPVSDIVFSANGVLNYEVKDAIGNLVTGSHMVTNIDKIAPAAGSAQLNPDTQTPNPVTVTVTAGADTGGSGVKLVRCGLNATLPEIDGDNNHCSIVVSENTTVYYQTEDNAGNVSAVTALPITNIGAIVPVAACNLVSPVVYQYTGTVTTIAPNPTAIFTMLPSTPADTYLLRARNASASGGTSVFTVWGTSASIATVQNNNNLIYEVGVQAAPGVVVEGSTVACPVNSGIVVDSAVPTFNPANPALATFTPAGYDAEGNYLETSGDSTLTIYGVTDNLSGLLAGRCGTSLTGARRVSVAPWFYAPDPIQCPTMTAAGKFYYQFVDKAGNRTSATNPLNTSNHIASLKRFFVAEGSTADAVIATTELSMGEAQYISPNPAVPVGLDFPATALETPVSITYATLATLPAAAPADTLANIMAFSLTNTDYTQGYTFADNYQMVIDLTPYLGSITNPNNLKLYYYNTSTLSWTQIELGIDLEQNIAYATLNHFTDFLLSEEQENYGNATIIVQSGGVPHIVDSLVTFEAKALTGNIQESVATLAAPWTAVDPSGSGEGWHVEITASDFVSGSHSIAIENTKVKQADANITMVYGNEAPASAQTDFASLDAVVPVKLLSASAQTGMGTYQFSPDFTLTIPATTYAGIYTAPVQLTIINAP